MPTTIASQLASLDSREHCDLQRCQTADLFAWFASPWNEVSVIEGRFLCMLAGHLGVTAAAADEIGVATASEAAVAAAREVELEQLQRQEAEDRLADALAQVSRSPPCFRTSFGRDPHARPECAQSHILGCTFRCARTLNFVSHPQLRSQVQDLNHSQLRSQVQDLNHPQFRSQVQDLKKRLAASQKDMESSRLSERRAGAEERQQLQVCL